jgi:DNA-binding IscR family transcriptional regulator
VRSQRGLGGGFALTISPDQLTVLQVIDAVDPMQRIQSCPLKLPAHGGALCPLHARLDAAAAMIEDVFGKCTIAELFDGPGTQTPLCTPIRREAPENEPETSGGMG